jgi:hypothetical protein
MTNKIKRKGTMTQISFYENGTGRFIKQWPNWSGVVPAIDDVVVLHYGDNNEEEVPYIVHLRIIDGTRPDHIKIFIEKITPESTCQNGLTGEEIDDLRREMKKAYDSKMYQG